MVRRQELLAFRRQREFGVLGGVDWRRTLLAAWVLLSGAGCAEMGMYGGTEPAVSAAPTVQASAVASDAEADEGKDDAADEPRKPTILQRGNDQVVALPEPRAPFKVDGEAVSLNFEEAPLMEVVHSIVGEVLQLDYVVEHPINGMVTLRTRTPIPRDQLLAVLESLLQSNGAVMVRDPNDRLFISSSPNARDMYPAFESAKSEGAGFSHVIVPLQFVSATEMSEILAPVAEEESFVRIDSIRNLLVLAGTRNQIDGWMEIISTFDIDQLKGMSVGVYPVEYSSVEIVGAALLELLRTMQSEGESGSALSGVVRVLPLEALDSILVITPRRHYLKQVGEWIARLDQPSDAAGEPSLYVYEVQNGDAGQMAELLSGLLGGGVGGRGGDAGGAGVAPGLTPMTSGSTAGGANAGGSAGAGSGGGNANRSGGAQYSIGDDVRVVADSFNNSLLVYAPRREYRKIEAALIKLDVVPKQVLIEASILEVQLVEDLQYGLEWAFNSSTGDYAGRGQLALGDTAIGPRVPGFSYTLTDSADAVRAVVNALAEDSLVNVISTPSIMVLDNHTASIQVGDQQPIQSGQVVTNGGNTTTVIEYKDTGVQLEVTPTVNAGGLVTMDISQSVIDVGLVDSATGQRSFLTRDVVSRVAIRSGESVVLGGLIRDNSSEGNNGIPILKDIPGLGALFSGTTKNNTRTELLVFITPRVMRNQEELRDVSAEMRRRMKGLRYSEDLPGAMRQVPVTTGTP
jgi:general secretion pathway protein D